MGFRITPRLMTLDNLDNKSQTNADRPILSATVLKPNECTFQHCVPCADLPQISLLGAFIHALLSRAYLSVRQAFLFFCNPDPSISPDLPLWPVIEPMMFIMTPSTTFHFLDLHFIVSADNLARHFSKRFWCLDSWLNHSHVNVAQYVA